MSVVGTKGRSGRRPGVRMTEGKTSRGGTEGEQKRIEEEKSSGKA